MASYINPSPDIAAHQQALRECRQCESMIPPVITCQPVKTPILMIGQAPGIREGELARPFAWTAGKTLFSWYASIGVDEATFRERVYMAAVCRCFPGKNPKGGDRVPDKQEVKNCRSWLNREIETNQPQLIIPVGKLAIQQFFKVDKLIDVIGKSFVIDFDISTDGTGNAYQAEAIALPHPSGLSTWFKTEPGKSLLQDALGLLKENRVWQQVFNDQY